MQHRKLAVRSTRVVLPTGERPACVLVDNGRVSEILDHSPPPVSAALHDFGDCVVFPGLVDTHIHINEPGRTEWEGFASATDAAASGGYTCLVDMPLNSIPVTVNVDALQKKRAAAAGQARVDYAFWGGAVHGNADQIAPLANAGVRGFKTFLVPSGVDEFSMLDEAGLRAAMPLIAKTGLPLLAHAELPEPIAAAEQAVAGQPPRAYNTYLKSRPDEAELAAIRLLIRLAREYRCRVHIVHLATSLALPELEAARAEGLPITVETCPHYLYFDAEAIADGATQFKCAPPLREAFHRKALWKALREGTIDFIATDHSPSTPEMKKLDSGDFMGAWGGIASVSLALAAIWTLARANEVSLVDMARWMSERPAALAGLAPRKGSIAVGSDADFAVFDPNHEWLVTQDELHFRHKISPYLGEHFTGRVAATFLRGELIYQDGKFPAPRSGRESV